MFIQNPLEIRIISWINEFKNESDNINFSFSKVCLEGGYKKELHLLTTIFKFFVAISY